MATRPNSVRHGLPRSAVLRGAATEGRWREIGTIEAAEAGEWRQEHGLWRGQSSFPPAMRRHSIDSEAR